MVEVVVSYPGETVVKEFQALVERETVPPSAPPPSIGLVEISAPQPTDTGSDILAKLLLVDGPGSGLDADLLDGQHGSYYLDRSHHVGPIDPSSFDDTTHGQRGGGNLHSAATGTVNGFMSGPDKGKLDGIEPGATQDQTPAEILTAIKTVDGSGSGLDADLLDGHDTSYFATAASLSNYLLTSAYTAADVLSKMLTVDGAGSALDSDLLDGQHGSYYLALGNATGTLSDAQHGNRGGGSLHALATPSVAGFMTDAPSDGSTYARLNGAWAVTSVFVDAPNDGAIYGRQSLAWQKAAPLASPTFTGAVNVPTATPPTSSTIAASTAFVSNAIANLNIGTYAPLASPVFTGDPRAPTPATSDNDTSIATTAFVQAAISGGRTADTQNLIVNGAVQHSQETAFNTTITVSGSYLADQWFESYGGPVGGTHMNFAAQNAAQNGGPTGMLIMSGTATAFASVGAGNFVAMLQYFEGQVVNGLGWGTAFAIPAVLAFEVFCSTAGTYAVSLRSGNNDRSIVFPITIAAGEVNTWKRITCAVPAITSGTFAKDNTLALSLCFTPVCGTTYQAPSTGTWQSGNYFGVTGQSNILATVNSYLYIRNFGLYADSGNTGRAPLFQLPDYATELARCKRYYQKLTNALCAGNAGAGQTVYSQLSYITEMRSAPGVTFSTATYSNASALAANSAAVDTLQLKAVITAAGFGWGYANTTLNARM